MKMHYKAGPMTFEIEGASPKELFKKIATVQEIFDTDKMCGACNSPDVRFRSRQVDDFEFFEIACETCTARLQFGQLKKGGGLFVKRRDDDGHELPNRGWEKYVPRKQQTQAQPNYTAPNGGQPYGRDARADHITDDDVPF